MDTKRCSSPKEIGFRSISSWPTPSTGRDSAEAGDDGRHGAIREPAGDSVGWLVESEWRSVCLCGHRTRATEPDLPRHQRKETGTADHAAAVRPNSLASPGLLTAHTLAFSALDGGVTDLYLYDLRQRPAAPAHQRSLRGSAAGMVAGRKADRVRHGLIFERPVYASFGATELAVVEAESGAISALPSLTSFEAPEPAVVERRRKHPLRRRPRRDQQRLSPRRRQRGDTSGHGRAGRCCRTGADESSACPSRATDRDGIQRLPQREISRSRSGAAGGARGYRANRTSRVGRERPAARRARHRRSGRAGSERCATAA